MKLNLGSGFKRIDGFVNVDSFAECSPDILWDLEVTPWPWEDNSVDEIMMHHSLEHIGGDSKTFLAIIKELYRICKPGAMLDIRVPHPRHDTFLGDPTHVRAISPTMLYLFSKQQNITWQKNNAANSLLALYLNVDFEIRSIIQVLDEPYATLKENFAISDAELETAIRERNNVISEYHMTIEVIK